MRLTLRTHESVDLRVAFTRRILRRISELVIIMDRRGDISWVNHDRTSLAKEFATRTGASIFDHPALSRSEAIERISQVYERRAHSSAVPFTTVMCRERVEVELIPIVVKNRFLALAMVIKEKSQRGSASHRAFCKVSKSFIDLLPQMIIFIDKHYKIVLANNVFVDYFNISYDQLSFCSLFNFIFQEDEQRLKRQIDSCFRDSRERRFAIEMTPGESLTFSLSHFQQAQDNTFVLLQSTDSGPLYREYQIDRFRYLSQFAGRIAHDLNNALSPVLQQLSLLRNQLGSQEDIHEQQNYIDIIQKHAKRIAEIIEDIGDLKNHKRDDISKVKLESVINQAKMIADIQRPHQSVHITTNYPPDLPFIECCEARMEKALYEIIMNGMEACGPDGQVHVHVEYIKTGKEKFNIKISDNGKGIPRARVKKIVEPFYTTKAEKWAGLGLTVAMGIVVSHNGFLRIQSEVNSGTIVTIELPRFYNQSLF